MIDTNLILSKAIEYGIIDLSVVLEGVETMDKANYLSRHTKIWQGKDGKWYTWLSNETGRRLIKKKTREEVENIVVDYYKSISKAPSLKILFDEWSKKKLEYKEICKGTYDRYENDFKRFFKDIEDMSIEDITEDFLEDFIKSSIADNNLSAKAYANMRTLIIGIFKYAKKAKYTNISISSFMKDMDLSRRSFKRVKKPPESQIFDDDETEKLIKWINEHPTVPNLAIMLGLLTGMREGELSAIKFSDLQGSKLHVQRQEIKYKENGHSKHEVVDYTKTEAGDRYIVLPNVAINVINQLREINPNEEYMMVFKGKRMITNNFNGWLYKACDAVGISRRSMHKLRKTYGTMLIDSGVADSAITSQLGHSDIATTRKYYYFLKRNDDKLISQLDSIFESYEKVINN